MNYFNYIAKLEFKIMLKNDGIDESKRPSLNDIFVAIKNNNLTAETLKHFNNLPALALVAYQLYTMEKLGLIDDILKREFNMKIAKRLAQESIFNQNKRADYELYDTIQKARVLYKIALGTTLKNDEKSKEQLQELLRLKNSINEQWDFCRFDSKKKQTILLVIDQIYEIIAKKIASEHVSEFFADQNPSMSMPEPLQKLMIEYADNNDTVPLVNEHHTEKNEITQLMNYNNPEINNIQDISTLSLVFYTLYLRTLVPIIHSFLEKEIPRWRRRVYDDAYAAPELVNMEFNGLKLFELVYQIEQIIQKILMNEASASDLSKLANHRSIFLNPEEHKIAENYKLINIPRWGLTGHAFLEDVRSYSSEKIQQLYGKDKEMLKILAEIGIPKAIDLVGDQSSQDTNTFRMMINRMLALSQPKKENKLTR